MVKKILFLSFFIGSSLVAFSQSANNSLNHARNNMERGEYFLAAGHYLDALKVDSLNKKANLEFGLLNTQYINNPGKAGLYLLRVERMSGKDTMPEVILGLAQYFQSMGEYQKATTYYKRLYSKMEKKPESAEIEATVTHNLQNCNYALSNPAKSEGYKSFKIVNAGNTINSIYPEYFPAITKKGSLLIYTARRHDNTGRRLDDYDNNYYEDMFLARKSGDAFTNGHPFSNKDPEVSGLSNTKEHEAVVTISSDGNKFYTFLDDKLYESVWQNNKWSAPKELNSTVNPEGAYQSYLSLSADGKTIYFSSERPDGLGKLDIYKSELQADGNWGPAINLGPGINTKNDDDSPFISYDGKTLFFASKGREGYGEYDLYKSSANGSGWDAPVNMGALFNSSGNDSHLTFNEDESSGVFASSRAGGFGDMDIYFVMMKGPFEDFVADANGRISINMPDTVFVNEPATLGVFSNKLPPSVFKRYYWQVNDSTLAADGEIAKYNFTKTGTARVRVAGLTKDKEYIGFEKNVVVVDRTTIVATNSTVTTNTANATSQSAGKSLDNIYFKFDQWLINPEAMATLNATLKLLKENPSLTISISAYCDSRGPDAYNVALSEKRARSTVWFLTKYGLDKSRIKNISWFGEKDPLNKCVDGTPCTSGEYKINRRVEFKIN